ncbi:hypothetical protein K474DRAFT_937356 [Panus rudis PR-1116 ss-1]|nr:hypothetical protein K474DRAFT_937356 [Panus rudis PR-1116 ss-1]
MKGSLQLVSKLFALVARFPSRAVVQSPHVLSPHWQSPTSLLYPPAPSVIAMHLSGMLTITATAVALGIVSVCAVPLTTDSPAATGRAFLAPQTHTLHARVDGQGSNRPVPAGKSSASNNTPQQRPGPVLPPIGRPKLLYQGSQW